MKLISLCGVTILKICSKKIDRDPRTSFPALFQVYFENEIEYDSCGGIENETKAARMGKES